MEASAKYYMMGLELGILSLKDIQTWVDSNITNSENPPAIFIDLAFATKKDVKDTFSLLSRITDHSDPYGVLRKLLGIVKDEDLEDIEYCRQLAKRLYGVWVIMVMKTQRI